MSFPFPLAPDLVAGKFSHSGPPDGPVPLPLLVDDSGPSHPCDTTSQGWGDGDLADTEERGSCQGARPCARLARAARRKKVADRRTSIPSDDSTIPGMNEGHERAHEHEQRSSQPVPLGPSPIAAVDTVLHSIILFKRKSALGTLNAPALACGSGAAWTGQPIPDI